MADLAAVAISLRKRLVKALDGSERGSLELLERYDRSSKTS